ncbi:MAG TPA: acyl-CoA dehydrogenase family protein [Candidatus Binataceae bacterium]|nr:acyl-CoA dehydrogenase family protein [Candidatus Binataceae bacterium]
MNDLALIEETARRTIVDALTPELVEAATRGVWPAAVWKRLEGQGMIQPAALTGDPGEAFAIEAALLRAAASTAAPIPLAEMAIGGSLLAAQGFEPPAGVLTLVAFAPGEELTRHGERVSGILERVPWARDASGVVAIAGGDLVLLDPKSGEIVAGSNLAGEPRDTVHFKAVQPLAVGGPVAREQIFARGAAARAVQLAAAATRVLEITVEYATQRQQFGRPIGNFQAIQHQLAAAAGEVASARVAAQQAYQALATDEGALFASAIAKTRAGDAAGAVARVGHQVHGAIGYTMEYQLQRFTRRIQAWRGEFGTSGFWTRRVGEMVLAATNRSAWSIVTSGF